MSNLSPYKKKTFYFYIIHACRENPNRYNFNYLDTVKKSLDIKNYKLLELANDINDTLMIESESYSLDNGIDVREFYFTGEIKEITEESYNIILADDKRIMANMSEKTKNLLTRFGIPLDGWHRPFKIEAKNRVYLKRALELKMGFKPIII